MCMTLFTEHSYSRVMVFIDYRNIVKSVRYFEEDDLRLDMYRLTQILVGERDLVGAYVFDSRRKFQKKDDPDLQAHNKLREMGFRVIAKDTVKWDDEVGKYVQKEVDVSLACEMLEHALMNHYDIAIVVSGDQDFVPAMQKVQSAGKRVEVAAFNQSCNDECKRAADIYYTLDDIPFMSMHSTTKEEEARDEIDIVDAIIQEYADELSAISEESDNGEGIELEGEEVSE